MYHVQESMNAELNLLFMNKKESLLQRITFITMFKGKISK
jgi:hypothetical protein